MDFSIFDQYNTHVVTCGFQTVHYLICYFIHILWAKYLPKSAPPVDLVFVVTHAQQIDVKTFYRFVHKPPIYGHIAKTLAD